MPRGCTVSQLSLQHCRQIPKLPCAAAQSGVRPLNPSGGIHPSLVCLRPHPQPLPCQQAWHCVHITAANCRRQPTKFKQSEKGRAKGMGRWRSQLPTLRCRLLSVWPSAPERVSQCRRRAGSWDPWGRQMLSRLVSAAAASAPKSQLAAPAIDRQQPGGDSMSWLAGRRPHFSCANSLGAAHLSTQCQ